MDQERVDRFIRAVAEMREQQRTYFATRTVGSLEKAKRAERIVDQLLAEIAESDPQRSLFR